MYTQMVVQGNLRGIVQEIEIWTYYEMVWGSLNKFPDFFSYGHFYW